MVKPHNVVCKPNETLHFCNYFWKPNEISKLDTDPMPQVDELTERLDSAHYITTLDLTKGYWQIYLTKATRENMAFSNPDAHFQY